MLNSAIGFFVLAAVLGGYLLSFIIRNKKIPVNVLMAHGLVATIGIILLVLYPFYYHPAPTTSLIVFIGAAVGGAIMAYMGRSGKSVPVWMAAGHGVVAMIGIITLVVFLINSGMPA